VEQESSACFQCRSKSDRHCWHPGAIVGWIGGHQFESPSTRCLLDAERDYFLQRHRQSKSVVSEPGPDIDVGKVIEVDILRIPRRKRMPRARPSTISLVRIYAAMQFNCEPLVIAECHLSNLPIVQRVFDRGRKAQSYFALGTACRHMFLLLGPVVSRYKPEVVRHGAANRTQPHLMARGVHDRQGRGLRLHQHGHAASFQRIAVSHRKCRHPCAVVCRVGGH